MSKQPVTAQSVFAGFIVGNDVSLKKMNTATKSARQAHDKWEVTVLAVAVASVARSVMHKDTSGALTLLQSMPTPKDAMAVSAWFKRWSNIVPSYSVKDKAWKAKMCSEQSEDYKPEVPASDELLLTTWREAAKREREEVTLMDRDLAKSLKSAIQKYGKQDGVVLSDRGQRALQKMYELLKFMNVEGVSL